MKAIEKGKSKVCVKKIVSLVFAVLALIVGGFVVFSMKTGAEGPATSYTAHCERGAYVEGGKAIEQICTDIALQTHHLRWEIQLTQALVSFSTAVILILFAFSNKNKS
ncbi:MAG: hypothetical protein Q4B65_00210 [Candidatus Saccharibacteria bacterium]|nr:hypothetical protein [Candidatus Saccharibacteria bacterium]